LEHPIIILVLEDDEAIQGLVKETLSDGGFDADIVASGDEAVSLLREHKGRYRALVTDIKVPGKFDGWEVDQYAREIEPEFPIVYMSGDSAADWTGGFVVPKSNWTPSIVPRGDDHDVYVVVDDLGRLGRVGSEADFEATDFETVVTDLLDGQYNRPISIFAFNAAEGWSRDVSADIAIELRRRCDLQALDVPSSLQDLVDRHDLVDRSQSSLPLRFV
jgi:hypothetical protein